MTTMPATCAAPGASVVSKIDRTHASVRLKRASGPRNSTTAARRQHGRSSRRAISITTSAASSDGSVFQQQQQQEQPASLPGGQHAPVSEAAADSSTMRQQWRMARDLIHEQQQVVAAARGETSSQQRAQDIEKTRQLVESAMLAAVTGLAFTLATLLKLEAYLAYILPLPVVIAALRSGAAPALKTVTTAFLLLFILTGPVRALTFLLIYGLLSLALGACWAWRLPWWLSIPAGALVRIAGYATYVLLSSWALGENLGALMVANAHALLDQMSAALGASGAPSPAAVLVTLASLLFVHSLFYVSLLHVFYAILLRGLGLDMGWERMPRFVQRMLGGLPDGSAAELGTTH